MCGVYIVGPCFNQAPLSCLSAECCESVCWRLRVEDTITSLASTELNLGSQRGVVRGRILRTGLGFKIGLSILWRSVVHIALGGSGVCATPE